MTLYRSKIASTGMFVPEKILTNEELSKMVDTNDEWITERTGIKERHISNPEGGEFPTDMACHAGKMALERAGMEPNDLDMILFATATPDLPLPSCATILQTKLGITNKCASVDLGAACSGFVYGLNIANSLIQSGMKKNILVIGAEMLSSKTDYTDRNTCVLFGDGAGAAIVTRAEENDESGILSCVLEADGAGKEFFQQKMGGSAQPFTKEALEDGSHYWEMKGREMFKVATRTLAANGKQAVKNAGLELDQVDWIISHQANIRIIETAGKLLGANPEKVINNIHRYGNTSAASIGLALHEAVAEGKIKRGDLVLLVAFGAGLTSGATLLRF